MEGSIGKHRHHPLTREALQNGFVDAMIARSGTGLRVLSDEERRLSLEATLAAQPTPGDVWLFAYGSLIWNPAFHYVERLPVLIRGWHRQFCLATPDAGPRSTPAWFLDWIAAAPVAVWPFASRVPKRRLSLSWSGGARW
jgi:cation transport protein ChaC